MENSDPGQTSRIRNTAHRTLASSHGKGSPTRRAGPARPAPPVAGLPIKKPKKPKENVCLKMFFLWVF